MELRGQTKTRPVPETRKHPTERVWLISMELRRQTKTSPVPETRKHPTERAWLISTALRWQTKTRRLLRDAKASLRTGRPYEQETAEYKNEEHLFFLCWGGWGHSEIAILLYIRNCCFMLSASATLNPTGFLAPGNDM